MKAAYLVTENEDAANRLQQLLSPELLAVTEIVSAGQKYAALSLTGTIMSERSRPVILVMDAESENAEDVKQREQFLEGSLLPAASDAPYKVCIVIPSIAEINSSDAIQQITQFLTQSLNEKTIVSVG